MVIIISWLRGVDLNHRPFGYEPNELPGCSTPRYISYINRDSLSLQVFTIATKQEIYPLFKITRSNSWRSRGYRLTLQ